MFLGYVVLLLFGSYNSAVVVLVVLLSYVSLRGFQKVQVIDPAVSIHGYSKNFKTIWHVLSVTPFSM
jgi:hypothetical protein